MNPITKKPTAKRAVNGMVHRRMRRMVSSADTRGTGSVIDGMSATTSLRTNCTICSPVMRTGPFS